VPRQRSPGGLSASSILVARYQAAQWHSRCSGQRFRPYRKDDPNVPDEPARCRKEHALSKILRAIAAGWGAKKLGGGCISTILVFLLLWWLLGTFDIFR
jgi:hypothetical protein